MDDADWLAERFAEIETQLLAVAYRMLGSLVEAENAVRKVGTRLGRPDAKETERLTYWLTTVVARECLDRLLARRTRRDDVRAAGNYVRPSTRLNPDEETQLAGSVGLALLVVLDTLSPHERLALVLHDLFGLPFDEVAAMVDRSPVAARQLANRARRRVRGVQAPSGDRAAEGGREVVDAFFSAGRRGDLDAIIALLHPDVVLRSDAGPSRPNLSFKIRGAEAVAYQARLGASSEAELHDVMINGTPGMVVTLDRQPITVMAFTVIDGKIVEIDAISDPDRVERLAEGMLTAE